MIFGSQTGKAALDGALREKINKILSEIGHHENRGWELIDNFAESFLARFSTANEKELLRYIKFLNP